MFEANRVYKFFIDQGHFDTKRSDGRHHGFFRTMVASINDADWKTVLNRKGLPEAGYYEVNGKRVAIGDKAVTLRKTDMPTGAKRYTEDHYTLALGRALAEQFEKVHPRNGETMTVNIGVTHTPNDYRFAPVIEKMLSGMRLNVTSQYGVMGFLLDQVETISETRGGYWNAKLRKDLSERERAQMTGRVCIVVDIGGGTTDVVIVGSDGIPMYTQTQSVKTGVNDVVRTLEELIKTTYRDKFKNGDPVLEKLQRAIETQGKYPYGRSNLDCSKLVADSVNLLLGDVFTILDELAPGAYYDTIILTGGGGEMFHKYIKERYSDLFVIRSSSTADTMRYANLDGMRKYLKVLTKVGDINGF